jgi:hypothetical protein
MEIKSGPRALISRGKDLTQELINKTQPLDRRFYSICVNKEAGKYSLDYVPKLNIAEALSPIIGDALGNYRSALDQLASNIVRSKDDKARVYFPAPQDRAKMASDQFLKKLEDALPGSTDLILNKIRPDNNPEDWIWKFAKINNDHKHNDIVPTVALSTIKNLNVKSQFVDLVDCEINGNANAIFGFLRQPLPITHSEDYYTNADIQFGEMGVDVAEFAGRDVIDVLNKIAVLAENTVNEFENLINSHKQ